MSFELEDAISVVNQAAVEKCDRHLTDLEIAVLKGVWDRLDYDQIAAQTSYSTSYISQDVAPRLWKLLSESLGEKVRKNNFKGAVQRYKQTSQTAPQNQNGRSPSHPVAVGVVVEQNGHSPSAQQPTPSQSLSFPKTPPAIQALQNYVKRPPLEKICYDALHRPGALVRLKAPRLMGKTSFITTVLDEVVQTPYRVVRISFEMADRAVHFSDLNRLFRWLCLNISRELKIPSLLDEYWEEVEIGAKVSCTTYFEEYLLAQDDRPLVLCLDDVDILFAYPEICEDFFGLLRSWYEKARTRSLWMQLRLVIVHSTNGCVRLHWSQSPFNVGLPLELPELNIEQIQQLAEGYQVSLTAVDLQSLNDLIGGHPALLDQAFRQLQTHTNFSLQQLLDEATTESSLFGHHLREHLLVLHRSPELADAFRQVISRQEPVDVAPLLAYQLHHLGLIKLTGNQATVRCQLYRQYFRDRLSLP